MPWNPLLIGYLKQCLWLLIIHDDPWRVRFFPSLSAKEFHEQIVELFLMDDWYSPSSFIFLYLLLSPSIYKASRACES